MTPIKVIRKKNQKHVPRTHFVVQNKRIRSGDQVMVIAGDEKGLSGAVLQRDANRAIVQGLNLAQKAVKKSEAQPQGGFVRIEQPINVSNLRLVNSEGKPVKLRVGLNDEGKRALFDRKTGVFVRNIKNSK